MIRYLVSSLNHVASRPLTSSSARAAAAAAAVYEMRNHGDRMTSYVNSPVALWSVDGRQSCDDTVSRWTRIQSSPSIPLGAASSRLDDRRQLREVIRVQCQRVINSSSVTTERLHWLRHIVTARLRQPHRPEPAGIATSSSSRSLLLWFRGRQPFERCYEHASCVERRPQPSNATDSIALEWIGTTTMPLPTRPVKHAIAPTWLLQAPAVLQLELRSTRWSI